MDSRKRNSKNQESKVAKELSGRVTPASGALWGAKADVKCKYFLVECKTTEKDFYSLTFNVWDKIYKEAINDGLRIPVMCIDLKNGKDRFAVMCLKDVPKDFQDKHPSDYALITNYSRTSSFRITKQSDSFIRVLRKNHKAYVLCVVDWLLFLNEISETIVKEIENGT